MFNAATRGTCVATCAGDKSRGHPLPTLCLALGTGHCSPDSRHTVSSRRVQDERAAQLKSLARLSALVTGFAMASFLQFNFDVDSVQAGVLVAYAATTALVVRPSSSACFQHFPSHAPDIWVCSHLGQRLMDFDAFAA